MRKRGRPQFHDGLSRTKRNTYRRSMTYLRLCWANGHYCSEHVCGLVWQRERQNGSCPVDRVVSEEAKEQKRWGVGWDGRLDCYPGPWCWLDLGSCCNVCLGSWFWCSCTLTCGLWHCQSPGGQGYTELALPLPDYNTRETWSWPSLPEALRRKAAQELTMFTGAWVCRNGLVDHNPFVCYVLHGWGNCALLPLSIATDSWWGTWTNPSPAAALRRTGPVELRL